MRSSCCLTRDAEVLNVNDNLNLLQRDFLFTRLLNSILFASSQMTNEKLVDFFKITKCTQSNVTFISENLDKRAFVNCERFDLLETDLIEKNIRRQFKKKHQTF